MQSDAPTGGESQKPTGGRAELSDSIEPPLIPDYRLLRRIGRGSYGTVWLAQNMMGSFRAVKIVRRDAFSDERPFERELSGIRRFEPISRSHDGFIDVLHIGINEEAGYFYYVMELGDDENTGATIDPERYIPRTLDKEISRRRGLSFEDCLKLGLDLTKALGELHKHGLVHRDVKPSNIIFVNGIPKLADIGLVADAAATASFVGTAGFIPPEGPGRPSADVYSLGKVLYEVSTGKDRQEFPELPTQVESLPDRASFLELNEVILRACQNDPARRYQTAWDMHADLVVLENGKSVRRLRVLERRFANLKRIGLVIALLVSLLAVIGYQIYREQRAVKQARRRQDVLSGNLAVRANDLSGALPYFADLLQVDKGDGSEEINSRLRLSSALALYPKLSQMWFEDHGLANGQISPDGSKILIGQYFGKAKIYDLQSGKLYLHAFGPEQGLSSVAFSRDGKWVVTADEDNWVYVWDAATLEQRHGWEHPGKVFSARFSSDGLRVVTAGGDGIARVWNMQTDKVELSIRHKQAIRFADFNRTGDAIVTCSEDHTARIWDAAHGQPIGLPLSHNRWVYYASFNSDGKRVATASGDHKVRIWDIATGQIISPELTHDDVVSSVTFSPDGRFILTASLDATVRIWRSDNFAPAGPAAVLRQGDRVTSANYDGEGRRILTTCADGTVRLWDLAGSFLPARLKHSYFSHDGRFCAEVDNGKVTIETTGLGRESIVSFSPDFPVAKIEFGLGNHFLLTESEVPASNQTNHVFEIWQRSTGKRVGQPICVTNSFSGASIGDDGKQMLIFNGKSMRTWDVLKGKPCCESIFLPGGINQAYLNPNGSQVAAVSGAEIHVYRAVDGYELYPPLKHVMAVAHAEFSADGSFLASCCSDSSFDPGYAQIWDSSTGRRAGPRLGHRDGVVFVTFSPDGKRVATAGEDFIASVWDASNGKQIARLQHPEKVNTVAFSHDGRWVVTTCADGASRVWDAESGEPLTPPFRHITGVRSAQMLTEPLSIITTIRHDDHYVSKLPEHDMSSDDFERLALLLSGNDDIQHSESLKTLWQRLTVKYPSLFIASPQEVTTWEEFQTLNAENERNWPASVFSLKERLLNNPNDATLQKRLIVDEQHVEHGD